MRNATQPTGERYPILRTLGILHVLLAAPVAICGIWAMATIIPIAPWAEGHRAEYFGLAFFATVFLTFGMLALAEVIKLLVDIELHTRSGGVRRPIEHRVETAESALIRGA